MYRLFSGRCVFFLNPQYKMSSTQSFLRQRHVGATAFNITTPCELFVMVAGSSNYVGNYPPGTMLYYGSVASQNATFGTPIFRDMGKTIQAPTATGSVGFFRAVQILNPVALASATAASNFGVNGSNPGVLAGAGDDGYNTFYIAIPVNGVLPTGFGVQIQNVGPIAANIL
jgi:hypothetical protein